MIFGTEGCHLWGHLGVQWHPLSPGQLWGEVDQKSHLALRFLRFQGMISGICWDFKEIILITDVISQLVFFFQLEKTLPALHVLDHAWRHLTRSSKWWNLLRKPSISWSHGQQYYLMQDSWYRWNIQRLVDLVRLYCENDSEAFAKDCKLCALKTE